MERVRTFSGTFHFQSVHMLLLRYSAEVAYGSRKEFLGFCFNLFDFARFKPFNQVIPRSSAAGNYLIKKQLRAVLEILRKLSDAAFTKDEVTAAVLPHAEAMGKGNVLWPMRVSLSGRDKSPDPFTLAAILGQRETLSRLTVALTMLK